MDSFEAYKTYIAVKSHFTQKSYDYFKYKGKVKANWNSFEKNNGKYFFGKLGRKYGDELPEFFASCFAYVGNVKWIGDFDSDDCDHAYTEFKRHTDALTRTFTDDIKNFHEVMETNNFSFKEIFVSKDGALPVVEQMRLRGLTTIETCTILDRIIGYTTKIKCINPLWDDSKLVIQKFGPFVKINDVNPFIKILRNELTI